MPNDVFNTGDDFDPVRLVRRCYDTWDEKDVDAIMACCAADAVYHVHVPSDVLRFAGRHEGHAAIRACLEAILAEYDFLAFAVDWISGTGATVRARVLYYYRHPVTGDQFDAGFRQVWRVSEGRVAQVDEYHDVARLKAFLDMTRGGG